MEKFISEGEEKEKDKKNTPKDSVIMEEGPMPTLDQLDVPGTNPGYSRAENYEITRFQNADKLMNIIEKQINAKKSELYNKLKHEEGFSAKIARYEELARTDNKSTEFQSLEKEIQDEINKDGDMEDLLAERELRRVNLEKSKRSVADMYVAEEL